MVFQDSGGERAAISLAYREPAFPDRRAARAIILVTSVSTSLAMLLFAFCLMFVSGRRAAP
jgi:hypothetical protein